MELDFTGAEFIPPEELSNEEYHRIDGISASGLKQAWKDPKLYFLRDKLMRIPSPALTMGIALHEAVLEPDSFDIGNYKLTPLNKTKLEIMINNAKLMFDFLDKTKNEQSLILEDEGFVRKVRVDAYDESMGVIYDVKTTKYNSPTKFIKDAYEYGYHLQAAFYIDTVRMAGYKADYFAFLCVPSDSPCEPFAVQITDEFIEDGRELYNEVLQNILDYKKSNNGVYFRLMDLPRWRKEQKGMMI